MFLNLMAQYNTSVLIVNYIIEYKAHPPPLLCYRPEKCIRRIRDQRILEHVRPESNPCEQERIPEPHARQPQHQRRRGGEEQQEGYVMEIPVANGRAREDIQV